MPRIPSISRALRHARGAVLVTALFAVVAPWGAAGEAVSAYAKLPLANRFRNRCWTPLTAVASNPTEKDAQLAVRFTHKVGGDAGRSVSFSRTVWVPAGGTREVDLSAYFDLSPSELTEYLTRRKSTVSLSEHARYADGVTVTRTKLPMAEPVKLDIELHRDGFPAMNPELFLALPLHPDAFNLLTVEGVSDYPASEGILRTDGGLDRVRGEIDESILVETADLRTLSNLNLPPAGMLGGRTVSPGTISSVEYFPRTWAAYQGIDTLVMGAATGMNGEMDALQRTSMLEWIISGGRLIIMPGGRLEDFLHPYFEKILPVRLVRERRIDSLSGLTARYGGACPVPDDTEQRCVEALAGEGEILARDGDRVLVARRRVGRGMVWFCAVKGEQIETWRQNLKLTAEMFWPEADPVPGLRDGLPEVATPLMQSVAGIVAPSRAVVLLILGGYAGAFVVLLVILRRRGKTEAAWPVAMLLAVVTMIAALAYGGALRASIGFVQGEIGVSVMGNGQGKASSLGYVAVYAGEKAIEADARFSNPSTLATASSSGLDDGKRSMSLSSLNVDQADRFYLRGLTIKGGELFTCNTMTLTDYANGVTMDFGYGAKGFRGTITNRTGETLDDCILVVNRRLVRIGTLAEGQTVDIGSLAPVPAEELVTRLSSLTFVSDEEARTRSRMLGVLRRIPQPQGGGMNAARTWSWPPTFYGWARRPLAYVTFGAERDPVQRSLQLLALPAHRVTVEPGAAVRVPAGSCGLRVRGQVASPIFGVPPRPRRSAVRRPAGPLPEYDADAEGDGPGEGPGSGGEPFRFDPAGVPGMQQKAVDPESVFAAPSWLPITLGGTNSLIAFLLPQGLEDLRVEKAALVFALHGQGVVPAVSIRRGDLPESEGGRWTPLALSPDGRTEIPDVGKYLGRKGELPQFQLTVTLPPLSGTTLPSWQVHAFDLELEGTLPPARGAQPLPPFDLASIGG